jgi:hypothetical protein
MPIVINPAEEIVAEEEVETPEEEGEKGEEDEIE